MTFSRTPRSWLAFPAQRDFDLFWTVCADEGTVVCMHLGSSSQILMTSVEAPIAS